MNKTYITLGLILIIGFLFRIYGINFDQTCCQHPDERAIVMYTLPIAFPSNLSEFMSAQSPLNTHFFAYGNLPLYLLKETSLIASRFNPELALYDRIDLVGRSISVFSDLITIILIFMLGKIIFNKRIGLAAAFVYAAAVLPIQYSHFYTSDILLTMFVTLTLFRLVKFYKNPGVINAILPGITFGLALATKISAIPLLVSLLAALIIDFLLIFIQAPHKPKTWLPHIPHIIKKLLTEGLVMLSSTLVTFVIAQPYSIIDSKEFIDQNLQQSQMTHNAYIFPYTLQYVGKIPYYYELKNIFLWGLGPIIGLLSIVGIILLVRTFKNRNIKNRTEIIIIFVFSLLYFAVVGKFAVGFMRYMLPIYPILATLAGITIVYFLDRLYKTNTSILKYSIPVVIFLAVIIWPMSFLSIYSATNTRIAASEWIHKNIPTGANIATEHWDDRLPLADSSEYIYHELTLYDQPDNTIKWGTLSSELNESQYIIIASNRLYVPIQKLENCSKYKVCYPIASQYYKQLFSGKLGFKKIAEFSSYPTIPLLNIPINDQGADESFTVYDHPKIMVFKKTNVVKVQPIM